MPETVEPKEQSPSQAGLENATSPTALMSPARRAIVHKLNVSWADAAAAKEAADVDDVASQVTSPGQSKGKRSRGSASSQPFALNAADVLLKQLRDVCRNGNSDIIDRWADRHNLPRQPRQPLPPPQAAWRTDPTPEELEARETRRKERLARHLAEKKALAERAKTGHWGQGDSPPPRRKLAALRRASGDLSSAASSIPVSPQMSPSCGSPRQVGEPGNTLPALALASVKPPLRQISASTSSLPRVGGSGCGSNAAELPTLEQSKQQRQETKELGQVRAVVAPYAQAFGVAAAQQRKKTQMAKSTSLPQIGGSRGAERAAPSQKTKRVMI